MDLLNVTSVNCDAQCGLMCYVSACVGWVLDHQPCLTESHPKPHPTLSSCITLSYMTLFAWQCCARSFTSEFTRNIGLYFPIKSSSCMCFRELVPQRRMAGSSSAFWVNSVEGFPLLPYLIHFVTKPCDSGFVFLSFGRKTIWPFYLLFICLFCFCFPLQSSRDWNQVLAREKNVLYQWGLSPASIFPLRWFLSTMYVYMSLSSSSIIFQQ